MRVIARISLKWWQWCSSAVLSMYGQLSLLDSPFPGWAGGNMECQVQWSTHQSYWSVQSSSSSFFVSSTRAARYRMFWHIATFMTQRGTSSRRPIALRTSSIGCPCSPFSVQCLPYSVHSVLSFSHFLFHPFSTLIGVSQCSDLRLRLIFRGSPAELHRCYDWICILMIVSITSLFTIAALYETFDALTVPHYVFILFAITILIVLPMYAIMLGTKYLQKLFYLNKQIQRDANSVTAMTRYRFDSLRFHSRSVIASDPSSQCQHSPLVASDLSSQCQNVRTFSNSKDNVNNMYVIGMTTEMLIDYFSLILLRNTHVSATLHSDFDAVTWFH